MNEFKVTIENIQHIKFLEYEIDLSLHALHCIVGKNGIGKTTLVKILQNFKQTDSLDKLNRLNVIYDTSKVVYSIDESRIEFKPIFLDSKYVLNTNNVIQSNYQQNIHTELPIPKGGRFNTFERLGGKIGEDIKTAFSTTNYHEKPTELIDIMNRIYESNDRFNDLEEIIASDNTPYYIKPINNQNYIREDDFSSGEYMLVQIYKLIKTGCKLIVIDELDISLDSSAQINLIKEIRALASENNITIIFTTHSLAIMKVMNNNELYYMEEVNDKTSINNKSYNYIKSLLFQFEGYDKIILTEDKLINQYLKYFLRDQRNLFNKYRIIDIAGHSQTVDLMERNKIGNFLGTQEVISVLDGDQKSQTQYHKDDIFFLPFLSVEKDIYESYKNGELDSYISDDTIDLESLRKATSLRKEARVVYYCLTSKHCMSETQIIEFINNKYADDVAKFQDDILNFLDS